MNCCLDLSGPTPRARYSPQNSLVLEAEGKISEGGHYNVCHRLLTQTGQVVVGGEGI